jgi:hypothetical protein
VTSPKICRPHAGIHSPSCHIDAGHPAPPATCSALPRFSSGRKSAGMMPVRIRILCEMHVHTTQPIMPPPLLEMPRHRAVDGLTRQPSPAQTSTPLRLARPCPPHPSTSVNFLLGRYSEDSELGCGAAQCVRGQLISRSVKAVRAAGRLQGACRAPYPYGDHWRTNETPSLSRMCGDATVPEPPVFLAPSGLSMARQSQYKEQRCHGATWDWRCLVCTGVVSLPRPSSLKGSRAVSNIHGFCHT